MQPALLLLLVPPEQPPATVQPVTDPRVAMVEELEALLPHLPEEDRHLFVWDLTELYQRIHQDQKAWERVESVKDPAHRVGILCTMAVLFAQQNRSEPAIRAMKLAMKHPEQRSKWDGQWAVVAVNLGEAGNLSVALDCIDFIDEPLMKARTLLKLAEFAEKNSHRNQTVELGNRALEQLSHFKGPQDEEFLSLEAQACLLSGKDERALNRFKQILRQLTPPGAVEADNNQILGYLRPAIRLLARLGEFPRAFALVSQLKLESEVVRERLLFEIYFRQIGRDDLELVLPLVRKGTFDNFDHDELCRELMWAGIRQKNFTLAKEFALRLRSPEMQFWVCLVVAEESHSAGLLDIRDEMLQQAETVHHTMKAENDLQKSYHIKRFTELARMHWLCGHQQTARQHLQEALTLAESGALILYQAQDFSSPLLEIVSTQLLLEEKQRVRALLDKEWEATIERIIHQQVSPEEQDLMIPYQLLMQYARIGAIESALSRAEVIKELPGISFDPYRTIASEQGRSGQEQKIPEWIATMPDGPEKAPLLLAFLEARIRWLDFQP